MHPLPQDALEHLEIRAFAGLGAVRGVAGPACVDGILDEDEDGNKDEGKGSLFSFSSRESASKETLSSEKSSKVGGFERNLKLFHSDSDKP